jgi:methyl-accepting chemotaxis protein
MTSDPRKLRPKPSKSQTTGVGAFWCGAGFAFGACVMGFSTIRSKIVSLLLLGGLCIALIAGVNAYSGQVLSEVLDLVKINQTISAGVMETMSLENRYLRQPDQTLEKQIQKVGADLNQANAMIGRLTANSHILGISSELGNTRKRHHEDFNKVVAATNTVNQTRKEIATTMAQLGGMLRKNMDAITDEETQKNMFGEEINPQKAMILDVYGSILLILTNKQLNVQDLFVLSDLAAYNKQAADLQKRLQIETKNATMTSDALGEAAIKDDWNKMAGLIKQVAGLEAVIVKGWQETRRLEQSLAKTAQEVLGKTNQLEEILETENSAIRSRGDMINLMVLIVGGIAFIILGVLIIRSVQKSLSGTIGGVARTADQVGESAGQSALSSKNLAEGASSQAASLEEISASLEEVASMTKANSENAGQADSHTNQAMDKMQVSEKAMADLSGAMEDIATSGNEISNIVNSIDGIAFQTNLLALNAAVEAARAGEAGAGFAVVADEVRSLAMRAAEAAKNTQELIGDTVNNITRGSDLVNTVKEGFGQVVDQTNQVATLVSEISSASQEQAQGIDQVSQAMAEIDKITQNNAAQAEESAAASQEMLGQSDTLRNYLDDLNSLVGGRGASGAQIISREPQMGILAVKKAAKPSTPSQAAKAIPLDKEESDDFEDF